jgi:dihydrofolate reductase
MSKVIADITMSLDGYVTGPGADPQHGLGDAPEIHAWVSDQDAVDTEILEGATAASGAVVMGRRLFDTVDGPDGWSTEMGYGAQEAGTPPFFVVTHSPPRQVRLEQELGMSVTFVSGLEAAIDQARAAAIEGDVVIMGGGDVIGQALEQGIVDEFHVHLAPLVLGGGTLLFRAGTRQRFRQRDVRPSVNAVHIIYERMTDQEVRRPATNDLTARDRSAQDSGICSNRRS